MSKNSPNGTIQFMTLFLIEIANSTESNTEHNMLSSFLEPRSTEAERTIAIHPSSPWIPTDQIRSLVFSLPSCYILLQYMRGHFVVNKSFLFYIAITNAALSAVFYLNFNLLANCVLVGSAVLSIRRLPRRQLAAKNKAVLITGCDRGIGFQLAVHLDKMGFHVFAGCLDISGENHQELVRCCSDRLQTIQLDVSNAEDILQLSVYISKILADTGVEFWGVVNNAGICYIGNVEMMPHDDIAKVMTVNCLGPVNVCKALLPLLRNNRGRIVNIASNAGLAPVPLMGIYCASKAALASITEVWRYELNIWGIKVSTVIPSGYKTGILAYDKSSIAERWWSLASEDVRRDYGKDCFNIKFKQKNHETMLSANFSEILNNIADALLSVSPETYYYNGFLARTLPFLYLHLPPLFGDPIMRLLTDWFEFEPLSLSNNT